MHNTSKICSLLYKDTKFIWSPEHQSEFDSILKSLTNLDNLTPYNPKNKLFAIVDASKLGLGFILMQKDSKGKSSILQAGSTSLKHAQVTWAIPELELLAVKYMFVFPQRGK